MKSNSQSLPASEVLRIVCRALDDKKAEDLRVLDVCHQSSITDYLVLATGNSEPHLRALRVELEKVMDQAKVRIVGMDTEQGSGWMVVDAFDVMVHLFTRQTRELYRLETLWKDAAELPLKQVLEGNVTPPDKAPAVKKPVAKKAATKKPVAKKASAKKPAAKKAAGKTSVKAVAAKKPVKKAASKAPAKKPAAKAKVSSSKKSSR